MLTSHENVNATELAKLNVDWVSRFHVDVMDWVKFAVVAQLRIVAHDVVNVWVRLTVAIHEDRTLHVAVTDKDKFAM